LKIPSTATARSGVCSMHSPTTTSGPTPRARRRPASRSARRSSSP